MPAKTPKLFLTSRGPSQPEALAKLLGRELQGLKAALIPNAREGRPLLESRRSVTRKREELEALGMDVFVTDLTVYRGESLRRRLEQTPLIWVAGGNTFCLRHRMRQSGFESRLPALLEAGVVYGGESAAAICAGPSLAPIEDLDEPERAEAVILEGLHLVDFFVLPHWQAPGWSEKGKRASKAAKRLGLEVQPLRDGQALVFDGARQLIG